MRRTHRLTVTYIHWNLKWDLRIDCWFVSFPWGMNEKPTCTLYGGRCPWYGNVHVGFFIHTSRKRKKNQLSILIIQFHIIFIQNLRANSRKIKQNWNWTESARINLPESWDCKDSNFFLSCSRSCNTGNLKIISDSRIRYIVSKGPKYRFPSRRFQKI